MKCEACGSDVSETAVFCQQCGRQIRRHDDLASPAGAGQPESVTPVERLRQAKNSLGDSEDQESEQVLWEGGYSAKAMIGSWVAAIVISVLAAVGMVVFFAGGPGLLIGAGVIVVTWGALGLLLAYRKLDVHYELTGQRFMHRRGILTRTTDRIEVIDMDDVTFQQGLIQRMLGVGTIRIESSDRSHPELLLEGIDDVQNVATLIDNLRRKERRRRGLHIEAI